MYGDIHNKLEKHVAEPLSSYTQKFPDIKVVIAHTSPLLSVCESVCLPTRTSLPRRGRSLGR